MSFETFAAALRRVPAPMRAFAIAGLGIVAFAAIVIGVASHTPKANLFASPLHPEQVTEVQSELASWNVPFTPVADNVVVDTRARNGILLRLSLAGVPHSHVETTNDTLANVGVLTPQAVIDAQTRSGLAGDIEMGLRSVDGVDDARVIIAPAKTAEFADESARDASASVRLRLHPGAGLGHEGVAGIRQFVASSVAGLDASRVTILDDRGIALADDAATGDDGDSLQRSLQTALDTTLGAGAAIVRVHADYSRSTLERRDVSRMPVSDLPIERSESLESYDSAGKKYEKHDERDDRGSDTRETVSRNAPGDVLRLSTAVFLDSSRAVDVEKVRELASATVGFSEKRGDSLVVQTVDFHRERQEKHDGWFLLYGAIVPLLPEAALAIGMLLIARMGFPLLAPLFKSLAERTSIERTTRAVTGYAPAHVRGALEHEPPHAAAVIISALPAATAAAVLELYPQHERAAIVARMQRSHAPFVPSAQEILGRHA